jgi:hypothetical protein
MNELLIGLFEMGSFHKFNKNSFLSATLLEGDEYYCYILYENSMEMEKGERMIELATGKTPRLALESLYDRMKERTQ